MIAILLFSLTSLPIFPVATQADTFQPGFVISYQDLVNWQYMSRDEIQAFLDEKGTLGAFETIDLDGEERLAADIIQRVAQDHGVNPKFIMVMMQKEQSLITDPTPSQRQLDWATG